MTSGGRPDGREADQRLLALVGSAFGALVADQIGVAVSGGGDSMALLHLMARSQAARGGTLRAVTVDHRLRPEAAAEARFVAGFCESVGIGHDTLVWEHGEIIGNLSDQARRARYGLISDWAKALGISHVVIGHTADDLAETFVMELARQAGIDGLAAMRPDWEAAGIHWARPLLSVERAALRDYLMRHGINWIEDPTNEDDAYQRVKARRALAELVPLGITVEGIATVAGHLAAARADLVQLARRAAEDIATTDAGEVIFDREPWQAVGRDTQRRLLVAALRWVSGADYAPRAAQIARLDAAIGQGRDATLWGCRVTVSADQIRVAREPKAVQERECATDRTWDNRWRISGPHESGFSVRALGADGLRQCENWRATGHSRAALLVSPAIWRGETLISAPLAGFGADWTAEIVAGFAEFVLSH